MPRSKKNPQPDLPQIPKELIDQLVTGPMAKPVNAASLAFKKALIERALGVELSHYLGCPPGAGKPEPSANQRNGRSRKTVITDEGPLALEIPRDRGGEPPRTRGGSHVCASTGNNWSFVMPKWVRLTTLRSYIWLRKLKYWGATGLALGALIRFFPSKVESGAAILFAFLALPGWFFILLQTLLVLLIILCRVATPATASLAGGDLINVSRTCTGALDRGLAVILGVIIVASVNAIVEPGKTHAVGLAALLLCLLIAFGILRALLRHVKHLGMQICLGKKRPGRMTL